MTGKSPVRFAPSCTFPTVRGHRFYHRFGAAEEFCSRNGMAAFMWPSWNWKGGFHVHETMRWIDALEPVAAGGRNRRDRLFVPDVDAMMRGPWQPAPRKSAPPATMTMATGRDVPGSRLGITGRCRGFQGVNGSVLRGWWMKTVG